MKTLFTKYRTYFKNKIYYYFPLIQEIHKLRKRNRNLILKKASKKEKIVVTFLVNEDQKWNAQTVYEEFLKDSKFIVQVAVVPLLWDIPQNLSIKQKYEKVLNFFFNTNIDVIPTYQDGTFINIDKIYNSDIVFMCQTWYFENTPFSFEEMHKKSIICYIPYSIDVDSVICAQSHPNFKYVDYIFTTNEFTKKDFNVQWPTIVVVSGYPKLDLFPKYQNSEIKKNGKTIIYAPHWTIEGIPFENIGFGNFHKYYKQMLGLFKKYSEIDFIFKPHPRLRYTVGETKLMTDDEWNLYINEIEKLPNCKVYDEGNYIHLFKECDGMIGDSVSFIGEFQPANKPFLFLESGRRKGLNDFGNSLWEGFYKGHSFEDIENFIQDVILKGNDSLKTKREKIIKRKDLYCNFGSAGKFIKNYITKLL